MAKCPLSAETLLLSVNAAFTNRKVLLEMFQAPYTVFGGAAESIGLWGRFGGFFFSCLSSDSAGKRKQKCVSSIQHFKAVKNSDAIVQLAEETRSPA